MTKVPQPKWLGDFLLLYYFGFAKCQPILYISNVGEYHVPTAPIITQMSMVLGLLTINLFRIFKA